MPGTSSIEYVLVDYLKLLLAGYLALVLVSFSLHILSSLAVNTRSHQLLVGHHRILLFNSSFRCLWC